MRLSGSGEWIGLNESSWSSGSAAIGLNYEHSDRDALKIQEVLQLLLLLLHSGLGWASLAGTLWHALFQLCCLTVCSQVEASLLDAMSEVQNYQQSLEHY